MLDLGTASAGRLAAAVKAREIGCLELLDHQIARIERLDPAINAVVVRDFERARDQARRLDGGSVAGGATTGGALRGVPMTVKESFDAAGLPTTWGLEERRSHRAETDAAVVQRLRAAGAVILGKTNVPAGLADWQANNALYGRTNNPFDMARTSGGSSGGAAAVAAGLSALDIGSDLFGSVRVPAHCCGGFGHKPTWDLVPSRGHGLAANAAAADISACGPMARSAADLALALSVLGGPESGATVVLPPARTAGLRGLRVAVWAEQAGHATDAATTALLHDLAAFLAREGAVVSMAARPEFAVDEAFGVFLAVLAAVLTGPLPAPERARLREAAAALRPDDAGVDATLLRLADPSHSDWQRANERRHQLRRVWDRFFGQWDVLLCPAFATPALPHSTVPPAERRVVIDGLDWDYHSLMFWPGITGGFHLPSTVAPLGSAADGLPIGVQIVGPTHGDLTTIAVAGLLEQGWRRFTTPGEQATEQSTGRVQQGSAHP